MQSKGFAAYKNSSSGGNEWKSDIHNALGLNIEVKTTKRLNLMKAWRQTTRDASMAKTEPILAIHFDQMRENEWLIVLHSEDWVELLASANVERVATLPPAEDSRQKRYVLENAKNALAKALKYL